VVLLTDGFNDRQAVLVIKDSLQNNLLDPLAQYSTSSRNWVHTDNPLPSAKYPRIQVRKRGPTTTQIISMGEDFVEWRSLVLDIQIWSKPGFKWRDSDGTYYIDEEFIKEWLDKIWVALKGQQPTLKASYGITGLKPLSEEDPAIEVNTSLFTGTISIRVWYFRK
jgi:hypothetical protein